MSSHMMAEEIDVRHTEDTLGWLDYQTVHLKEVKEEVEVLEVLLLIPTGNEDII